MRQKHKTDRQADRQAGREAGRQRSRHEECMQAGREAGKQTDRQFVFVGRLTSQQQARDGSAQTILRAATLR